jgi:hypothetical protein
LHKANPFLSAAQDGNDDLLADLLASTIGVGVAATDGLDAASDSPALVPHATTSRVVAITTPHGIRDGLMFIGISLSSDHPDMSSMS